jgi:uncharacterized membrane protein YdbT with pleckstrin-like domain
MSLSTLFTSNEQHLQTVRKHPLVLFGELLPVGILLALPFILARLIFSTDFFPPEIQAQLSENENFLTFLAILWFLILWMRSFHVFIDFYLDTWIITTKRVISIEQVGFFTRKIQSTRMDRIQDIMTDIDGIVQTVFNIGTIRIKSAGATDADEFIIRGVGNPRGIRERILQAHDKAIEMPNTKPL